MENEQKKPQKSFKFSIFENVLEPERLDQEETKKVQNLCLDTFFRS